MAASGSKVNGEDGVERNMVGSLGRDGGHDVRESLC